MKPVQMTPDTARSTSNGQQQQQQQNQQQQSEVPPPPPQSSTSEPSHQQTFASSSTTNNLSSSLPITNDVSQQITTKVSTTAVEKNCLNISKVECLPKKSYQENFSFINTICIAKSIYEFSSVETTTTASTTTRNEKHESDSSREFLIKSTESAFEGVRVKKTLYGGQNNRHIKQASSKQAGAPRNTTRDNSSVREDSMKSKSFNDFSASSSLNQMSSNSIQPLTDQRFIDLISLLKLEN